MWLVKGRIYETRADIFNQQSSKLVHENGNSLGLRAGKSHVGGGDGYATIHFLLSWNTYTYVAWIGSQRRFVPRMLVAALEYLGVFGLPIVTHERFGSMTCKPPVSQTVAQEDLDRGRRRPLFRGGMADIEHDRLGNAVGFTVVELVLTRSVDTLSYSPNLLTSPMDSDMTCIY